MYFFWNVCVLLRGGKTGNTGVKSLNKMLRREKALAALGTQELEKATDVGSNLPEQRNWIELGFMCYYLFSSNESQIIW